MKNGYEISEKFKDPERFDQIVGKAVVRYYPSFKWLG